jgi:hypothetical protein
MAGPAIPWARGALDEQDLRITVLDPGLGEEVVQSVFDG